MPPNGVLIVNISNHIRAGKEIDVVQWHKETLEQLGFIAEQTIEQETPRMRYGANSKSRVAHETIFLFRKVG